jgi:DNA-binding NtrC family response regulator
MARILVIDDELHIRTIIEKILTIDNHEVDLAENGKAGLKLASLNDYDLVITDVVMPEQDGLEVITGIKRLFPHIRIIVMTGGAIGLDIAYLLKTAKLMGADRMLPKPLDFEKLQDTVKEMLATP